MKNVLPDFIPVVDGRKHGWEALAAALCPTGLNFVAALADDIAQKEALAEILGLPTRHLPGPLLRWEVFGLNCDLGPAEFSMLREALDLSQPIYFVEAVLLPVHRPGELQPWLVVDELRGIVEDCVSSEAARAACKAFLQQKICSTRSYPQLSVYRWEGVEWHSTRSCA